MLTKECETLLIDKDLLIFDFDGTIADTETYHWRAYNELLKDYNVKLEQVDINKYIGNPEIWIYEMIKKDFQIEFDDQIFLEKRLGLYLKLVKKNRLRLNKYFEEIINKYPDKKYAILSSQRMEVMEELLDYWGIRDLFINIVSVSDGLLTKDKVLQNVEQYFDANHSRTALFEDTNKNLVLAGKYGITPIGIIHRYNSGQIKDCKCLLEGDYE